MEIIHILRMIITEDKTILPFNIEHRATEHEVSVSVNDARELFLRRNAIGWKVSDKRCNAILTFLASVTYYIW